MGYASALLPLIVTRYRHLLKPLLSGLVVLCIGWFFSKALARNWQAVRAHSFQLSPAFLVCAAVLTLGGTLLATFAWYLTINALSIQQVDFKQSVAATNVSGLSKYIPGKVWSYALQMYWLDGLGISKALVVYVGLLNQLISLGVSVIFGLVCLLFARVAFPTEILLGSLAALLLLDAASISFNHAILRAFVALINRVFKRSLVAIDVKKSLLVKLHLIHFVAALSSGLAAYAFCFAIGYGTDVERGLAVVGSSALGDVAGFLAIIVPGGLGVREGLMYALLGGQATGSLAVVFPVASRMLSMFCEVMLGLVALRLLRTLRGKLPGPAA